MTEIDTHLAAGLSRRFRLVRCLGAGGMGGVLCRAERSPTRVRLQPGAEQHFKVILEAPRFNVARLADKVTWTVNGITGGDAQVDTIDAKGLYDASARGRMARSGDQVKR